MPVTRYARSGDVAIAYQVVGTGPIDLVFVPMFSNLVWYWQHPLPVAFFRELASFSRLILLDRRGMGLSDRPRDLGPLETRMDDVRAVLDAVGSERAALFGEGPLGRLCLLFAATYPERTEGVITFGTLPRPLQADWSARVRETRTSWGDWDYHAAWEVERPVDPEYMDWWVNLCRLAVSPSAAAQHERSIEDTDVSDIVSAVRVPALVFYEDVGDEAWQLGEQLSNAQMVPLDMLSPWETPELVPAVKRFLLDHDRTGVPDSVLATLLA